MNPLLMTDGYKSSHHKMYPQNMSLVYSNFTCRSTHYMPENAKKIVVFGIQYMVKYIQELFQKEFFEKDKTEVCGEAKSFLSSYLNTDYDVSHFEALHDLGYLPICIKALDEGTVIDEKIPILTIYNTHSDFFWLPNFLETLISSLIWKPIHSASIAYAFKKLLLSHAKNTDEKNLGFVDFQGHDFSFRGMQSPEAAISSGMGFLTSFKGTDTIPALQAIKKWYGDTNVAFSVPASEHAVVTSYGKEDEIESFRRIMKVYPTGILSMVSDSFDLWKVCTEYLPQLKEQILSRDGKLVIRPDSGNPADIICGTNTNYASKYKDLDTPTALGVVQLLWNVFGGTTNSQGYKVLDSHIGVIYGDSINLERADEICKRLQSIGFASTNIVLGVGSYSLGYATRDNQGGAMKATYGEITHTITDYHPSQSPEALEPAQWDEIEPREIFKDPITDDGTKKSKKGLLCVHEVYGKDDSSSLAIQDQCTWKQEQTGLLTTVFKDGKLIKQTTLEEIRNKLNTSI